MGNWETSLGTYTKQSVQKGAFLFSRILPQVSPGAIHIQPLRGWACGKIEKAAQTLRY
jgi:hypothetical protein